MIRSKLRHQSGMTLTELMIAIGIGGVLVLMFGAYVRNISFFQERLDSLNGLSRELTDLRTTVSNASACTTAFKDLAFNPAAATNSVPVAKLANLQVQFFNNEHINLNSASLKSASKMDTIVSGGVTYDRYLADLEVLASLASNDPGLGGQEFKRRSVPMLLVVNAGTNQIFGCDSNFDITAEYCAMVGGVYDSSKYPKCQLPVFKADCSGNKVASGVDPNGVLCNNLAKNPTGPKTKPTPKPVSVPFISSMQVLCNGNPTCSCPEGMSEVTRSTAGGGSLLCSGYTWTPPGKTVVEVANCWDWQATNFPNDTSCLRMTDGTTVKHGFGPCRSCPF